MDTHTHTATLLPSDDDPEQECSTRRSVQFSNNNDHPPEERTSSSVVRRQSKSHSERLETEEVVAKPSGSLYNQREYTFVLAVGVLMAFNSGYINGCCLSGFLAPGGSKQAVSSFTIVLSQSALSLADGEYDRFGFLLGVFFSFAFGGTISGLLTPDPTPYRIEPNYGPTFLIGAGLLGASSILAAVGGNENWVFYLAACANGIQNGVTSAYSENLIRSTGFTGPGSDIGIYLAQMLRGDNTNVWRLTVLSSLVTSYWVGGIISFWISRELRSYSLLFNAGLFVVIGVGLVVFLVKELGISVKSALLGTWEWKKAIDMLHAAFEQSSFDVAGTDEERFEEIFDRMDKDGNGSVTPEELCEGLTLSGVAVTLKQCKCMVRHADKDGNGMISREEWMEAANKSSKRLRRVNAERKLKDVDRQDSGSIFSSIRFNRIASRRLGRGNSHRPASGKTEEASANKTQEQPPPPRELDQL